LLDQVLTLRDDGFLRTLTDLCRITRQLRRNPPDLFLDFEQFLRITGLLARFSRTRHAIGFETPGQARARLHQARVPYDDQRHMAEVFGDIVRATGASIDCLPPLEVPRDPAAAQRTAQQLKGLPRPWMVFHPGSGDNFPGRRWPAERFIEAGVLLQQRFPGTLFLTGSKAEQQLLTQIQAGLQQRGVESISLAGQLTLPDLVAWMDAVDFLLTNDTGPVHLASAVGTPVVALYGPNTPLLYGPLGDRCKALYHALPCSPCLTNQNAKTSQCRLPACILALSVAEVVQAASELLLQTDAPQTTKVQQ
jgi:ADP-heptose:LPS heptosyltransferase